MKKGWRSANLSPDRRVFFSQGRGDVRSRALAARVTASFGSRGGASLADLLFPLFFPPTLLSVTPNSGPGGGATSATLAGLNFRGPVTVTFGGSPATDIVVVSSTQVTCTVPAHADGAVSVQIVNDDGQSSTLANGYTYLPMAVLGGTIAGNTVIFTSFDGITWTPRTVPNLATRPLIAAAGNSLVVGLPVTGGATGIISPNGIDWTTEAVPQAFWGCSPEYNANLGLFAAVGTDLTGTTGAIYTSPDGVVWTSRAAQPDAFVGLCPGQVGSAAQFLATGRSIPPGSGRAEQTPNGTAWAPTNALPVATWNGAAFNGTTWISTSAEGSAISAPDGDPLTWTNRTIPAGLYRGATFGAGTFVTVGTNVCATSPDGITAWTARTIPAGSWFSVEYFAAAGLFIACSTAGATSLATSPDGITWTPRSVPAGIYNSIAILAS
jgi:hypothetical protein